LRRYRLSNQARADLREIIRYTFETWGIDQARRYAGDLLKCFERVAESPSIGRPCDQLQKGYRRLEHGRHVVFYRVDQDGVFIGRILHQRMLPNLGVIEDS
jgi:toxin ParE1/3/4